MFDSYFFDREDDLTAVALTVQKRRATLFECVDIHSGGLDGAKAFSQRWLQVPVKQRVWLSDRDDEHKVVQ